MAQPFKRPLIGVIGAGECDRNTYHIAQQIGKEIATHGLGLVCGGLGGVMEAAAKGCQQNGGLTVGLLPQDTPEAANPYLDIVIPTGMGIMRNVLVVRSAVGLIAVGGRYGTLSELAFALQLGKPVVGIKTWDISDTIVPAENPHEALRQLLSRLELTHEKTNR